MKSFSIAILFFFTLGSAQVSQEKILYKQLFSADMANVVFPDSISDNGKDHYRRPEFLGFIGNNYQRFYIHIISCTKDRDDSYLYRVSGKTRVGKRILNITGTMKFVGVSMDLADDVPPGKTAVDIISEVELFEERLNNDAGVLNGSMTIKAYVDEKGIINYNAFMLSSDGYSNNQFMGTWKSYQTGREQKCNWGEFRIPESSELDQGAGEFAVNEKYIEKGWQSLYYSHCCGESLRSRDAIKEEEKEWWK